MPQMIYRGNDAYLVFCRGYAVYHLEGDRLRACAAILVDQNIDNEAEAYPARSQRRRPSPRGRIPALPDESSARHVPLFWRNLLR